MKVILLEEVRNLGKSGEQVTVKEGYARNYLIPRKLALQATAENLRTYINGQKARIKKAAREAAEAKALGEKISALSLTISRLAGEEDKLFGSVTNADVAESLEKEGIKIDKRKISLAEPLRALGIFEVPVHLHSEVTVNVKVWIVKE
jgi:large subunit ribosomal protein L9